MDNLLVLTLVCFIAMVSPGPDFVLVARNSLMYSRPQALATAFGVVTGCFIHATYCLLGLALIITKSAIVFATIKYAGACYLIYLGVRALTAKVPEVVADTPVVRREISIRRAFMEGLLCNVLNPKLAVFLLSLFTQFISVNASFSEKAVVAGVFTVQSVIYWPALVFILQSSVVRRVLGRVEVFVDRVCGLVLITIGLRVAVGEN